jgi:hypothetical protein
MSIWVIVFLVVWGIGNILWNYRIFKLKKCVSPASIFQGFFAGIMNLPLMLSEYISSKFPVFWNYPILMSKELRDDIRFLKKTYPNFNDGLPEMVIHEPDGKEVHFTAKQVDKLGKELIEEIKKQAVIESKKKGKRK